MVHAPFMVLSRKKIPIQLKVVTGVFSYESCHCLKTGYILPLVKIDNAPHRPSPHETIPRCCCTPRIRVGSYFCGP